MVVMETLKYICIPILRPCITWFASLRSEEVVIGLRPFFVHGCHGNAEIHMRTKFRLHALYGVQV